MNRPILHWNGEPLTPLRLLQGIAGAGMVVCIVFAFLVIAGAR